MVLAGRAVLLALGAAVFVALFAALAPARSAHAQEPPDPVDGTLTIYKACLNFDEADAPFDVEVQFELEPPGIADPPDVELECDDSVDLEIDDELFDLLDYLSGADPADDATLTVVEINVPSYVDVSYDDCELDREDIEGLAEQGIVCVITNEFDLPDLTINKVCPSGSGGATFNVLLRQGTTASGLLVAGNGVNCGGSFDVEDLEPGSYRIQEVIGGTSASSFVTSISCVDANGQSITQNVIKVVRLELGQDANCAIFNILNGAGPVASPTAVAPVVINNVNTNTINNTNANTNANANTNTQQQSNQQTQVNDNNQTTTVNSGPEVNISGVPRPQTVSSAAPQPTAVASPVTTLRGPSTGNGGLISPPRTGDAGLVNENDSVGGAYLWVIMGGIAGATALGTLRFGRKTAGR